MQARTELFLHIVSEYFGGAFSPPLASRFAPFEPWGYSDSYVRQVQRLRQRALLEDAEAHEGKDRIYRLTAAGRNLAAQGIDPHARWARAWDQTWRLVAFDMPEERRAEREVCRRGLRRLRFGCLQGSVWVSPDPTTEVRAMLEGAEVRTKRLIFIEGRPAAGESDAEIVDQAWDFERIGKSYAQYLKLLETLPAANASAAELRTKLPAWARREFALWKEILAIDPFLPAVLLPPDYSGRAAVSAREAAFRRARLLVTKLAGD